MFTNDIYLLSLTDESRFYKYTYFTSLKAGHKMSPTSLKSPQNQDCTVKTSRLKGGLLWAPSEVFFLAPGRALYLHAASLVLLTTMARLL